MFKTRFNSHKKLSAIVLAAITLTTAGCNSPANVTSADRAGYVEAMQEASTTPFGAYPETITYTLGKMTSVNNSNMPEGDTYTDNAYTRYIKSVINVQNVDVFEANDTQYNTNVSMAISMNNLPDIMLVSSQDELEQLVEADMIEDLTDSFTNCLSDRVKEMYASYGDSLTQLVTFDGKIMALPETNITDGPNLVWLRKDWMDKLGLDAPETIDDVVKIVSEFIDKDPGGNGVSADGKSNTVGLVVDTEVTGECGYSSEFLLDIIFACFGAYPKQWIYDEFGEVVYGSVTDEARQALEYISGLYEQGIIDNDFLLRTSTNICELIENGQCGSFFGPWWAPNNPLVNAVNANPEADWQPYLIATDADGSTSYHSQNPCYKYVVVRKGYEHPEIAAKMISVMFDKVRFECTDDEEFANYYQLNVEPTARPLSINVDYSDALSKCYTRIEAVLSGESEESELELLERSYYEACREYIEYKSKKTDNSISTQWAAYMSRIGACSLLDSGKINVVESLYFKTSDTMKSRWWRLKEKEQEAYLKIICGAEDISYFDRFAEEWSEQGGSVITEEVRASVRGE